MHSSQSSLSKARRGPLVPLVNMAVGGDVLVETFVRPWLGQPGGPVRSELAGLVDYNMVGSGLAALAEFEASPPASPRVAPVSRWRSRRPGAIGIKTSADVFVADDHSADLGLALALYGAAAERDLGHVVATGTLRRSGDDSPVGKRGAIFPVGGMAGKCALVADHIEAVKLAALTFIYPAKEAANPDEAAALQRLEEVAAAAGCVLTLRPVGNVSEALSLLRIGRAPRHWMDLVLTAAVALVVIAAGIVASLAWLQNRTVAVAFEGIEGYGPTPLASPFVTRMIDGLETYCRPAASGLVAAPGDRLAFQAHASSGPPSYWFGVAKVGRQTGAGIIPIEDRGCAATQSDGFTVSCHLDPFPPTLEFMRGAFIAVHNDRADYGTLTTELDAAWLAAGGSTDNDGVERAMSLLRQRANGWVEFEIEIVEGAPCL